VAGWLANEEPPVRVLTAVWLERGTCTDDPKQECPRGPDSCETTEVLMTVIIGIDPHKASHTAVAIGHYEGELGRTRVRATGKQVPQLLAWAQPLGARRWAIESAGGLGYLLAQQLVEAGEIVVDAPATLASRIRVLGTGKNGTHALRHFYASALLDGGESIRAVSEYLGHADPGFTLRVYTHLMPSSAERTRRAIDAVFGPKESAGDVTDMSKEGA